MASLTFLGLLPVGDVRLLGILLFFTGEVGKGRVCKLLGCVGCVEGGFIFVLCFGWINSISSIHSKVSKPAKYGYLSQFIKPIIASA